MDYCLERKVLGGVVREEGLGHNLSSAYLWHLRLTACWDVGSGSGNHKDVS